MTGRIYCALMALGSIVLPALIGHMDIHPLCPSWGSRYTVTKELHVWNRQNESSHLVTQWSQHIVRCFVIWITEPMGQETDSLTVSFTLTLTFSTRKQCRHSPSNHTLTQSESQGWESEERCGVSRCTHKQPMEVLFSSDDRLRRVVVGPEPGPSPNYCILAL